MDALEELIVWQRSTTFAIQIYKTTTSCKDLNFKSQITRAAVSIASNIAEGYERNSKKEFAQFLKIAKGSCAEVRTQLYIGYEIGLFNQNISDQLIKESLEISKMLQGLINYCHKVINRQKSS